MGDKTCGEQYLPLDFFVIRGKCNKCETYESLLLQLFVKYSLFNVKMGWSPRSRCSTSYGLHFMVNIAVAAYFSVVVGMRLKVSCQLMH